ncbi:hypothetical protein [Sphingobacterium suaedae]|uniref:Uncharacterized protein n=1 Tax=Sphingobacterium suaedae TaxID=1686402 RepID=A0ABW5KN85_9SPHI
MTAYNSLFIDRNSAVYLAHYKNGTISTGQSKIGGAVSATEDLFFMDTDSGKTLKRQLFDDIEQIIYKSPTEGLSYAKEGNGYIKMNEIIEKIDRYPKNYSSPNETIAFLLNRELRVSITEDADHFLDRHPKFLKELKEKDFYGQQRLKEYIQVIYQAQTDN